MAGPTKTQPKAAPALELRLFGELRVLRDGREVGLPPSKKARALLAYLVATGRSHTRESLCDLLWEGPDDPRAALRWSLAKLRPLLDAKAAPRLLADRERVAFEPAGASVDLHVLYALASAEALRAASTDALERAAALLRGELLDGLALPDCYRFSEWCRGQREATRGLGRALRMALLERLADSPERALVYARGLVESDPLDETAHARVIELLGSLGRNRDALRQYETCKRILAVESGARPSPLLEQARASLGAVAEPEDRPEPPPTVAVFAGNAAAELPLFGRASERAALTELLSSGAGPQALLLLGEPGVGKTRLLDELERIARACNGRALRGRAFEAEMIRPYGAWIDALRVLEPPDPFATEQSASSAAGSDRSRLFAAIVSRLRSLCAGGAPLVVIFDDIHWIDEASAALAHYAVRTLGDLPLRLACAARPGELGDNPAARRLVRTLTREGRVRQVALAPLGRDETLQLARTIGDEIDAERVFAESGGNPLFALEVARALSAGVEVAGSLDSLLRERLELLEGVAAEVVTWAAALGGAFSTDVLLRVSGLDARALLRATGELERRALFRPVDLGGAGAGYDFAHDLFRRAAYQAISEPRRRLMHGSIASALSDMPDDHAALAGDVAHHAGLGGDFELAAEASAAAAERCVRLFASGEARALVERGLRCAEKLTGAAHAKAEVHLLSVAIYADTGLRRAKELEAAMQRALTEAERCDLSAALARGLAALSYLHFSKGDFAGAASDSLRAELHARMADPEQALRAISHSAQCLALLERDLPRVEAMLGEATRLATALRTEVVELVLTNALIRYQRAELEAAISLFEQGHALAAQRAEHWLASIALTRLAMSELLLGRPAAASGHCRALREVAARMGGESSEDPLGAALEAVCRRELGQTEAEVQLVAALERLRELDAQAHLAEALCFAAEADLRAGARDAARSRAGAALRAVGKDGRASSAAWAHSLLAREALARGDSAGARAELALAQALLHDQPQPMSLARHHVERAASVLAAAGV